MPYQSGVVAVGTTATPIITTGSAPNNDGVLIQNQGAVAVVLGGAGVTATTGYSLAASATVTVPTTGAEALELYGVTASGTANVGYLAVS